MPRLTPIEQSLLIETKSSDLRTAVRCLAGRHAGANRFAGNQGELESLATRLGVRSIAVQAIPCDGLLIHHDYGYEVKLSSSTSVSRRRFSLAHEIAHIILHKTVKETQTIEARGLLIPQHHRSEERICDMLATELLMPFELVKAQFQRKQTLLDELCRLAKLFSVSLTAMARRLKELELVRDAALLEVVVDGFRASAQKILTNYDAKPIYPRSPWRLMPREPLVEVSHGSPRASGHGWISDRTGKRRVYMDAIRMDRPSTYLVLLHRATILTPYRSYEHVGWALPAIDS